MKARDGGKVIKLVSGGKSSENKTLRDELNNQTSRKFLKLHQIQLNPKASLLSEAFTVTHEEEKQKETKITTENNTKAVHINCRFRFFSLSCHNWVLHFTLNKTILEIVER